MVSRTTFLPPIIASLLLSFAAPSSAQNAWSPVSMDPTYRTVVPLTDDEYPRDASHIRVVSAILSSIILAFVGISFVESKRWNSTVPTALTIGAASCVFAEAVNCYLANVWWTASHDPSQLMFTLLGREFDLYVGIVWWSFGAVMSGIIYGALARNVRSGTLWALLVMCAFWDFVIEECMLNYGGLYTYYGHQPLVLFKLFPCWWMFGNVSGIFFGISITYRYRAWFNGWRSVFLLPILPFCYVGPQVLAGMPTMYVINGDYSPLVTELCGVLTCCIAVVQVCVMMDMVLGRDPLDCGSVARGERRYKERKLV